MAGKMVLKCRSGLHLSEKNFWNGVPARSATKLPFVIGIWKAASEVFTQGATTHCKVNMLQKEYLKICNKLIMCTNMVPFTAQTVSILSRAFQLILQLLWIKPSGLFQ
jgi:hypothetical protein